MTKLDSTRMALHRLADGLDARRRGILEIWRDRVAADATLDADSEWSLRQFNDHFPDVLERLGRALRAWPDVPGSLVREERALAVAHARTRWIEGYSLRGVVREWGHLNATVVDQLVALAVDLGDASVARMALAVWSRVLNDQQSLSALEYHTLEQAEAETRGAELMRALEALRSASVQRMRAMDALASTMRNDLQVVMTASSLEQDSGDWHEAYELRKLSQDGFRSLEQALSDMVTLSLLEAGHETRSIGMFDAAQGLALLVESLQPLATGNGAVLRAHGPERLQVEGDPERVRRLARHLLLCALRAGAREVVVHWSTCPDNEARWRFDIEYPVPAAGAPGDRGSAHALVVATEAVNELHGDASARGDRSMHAGGGATAAGDGIDLLIARHLCVLLDGALRIDVDDQRLRYRVALPVRYRTDPPVRPENGNPVPDLRPPTR